MPKQTREQRAEREALEEQAAKFELDTYYLSVPKRLMNAVALAQSLGISTDIGLTEHGPKVHFRDDSNNIDETLTYQTEKWVLEDFEDKLKSIKEQADAQVARRALVKSIFDKMTEEEKLAIKENIWMLK